MKKIFTLAFVAILFLPNLALARPISQITDWYLKDFHSEIIVNRDSSLNISESIIADAGNLPNKHGIFRVLPTYYKLDSGKKINMPLTLTSITNGRSPLPYDTIKKSGTVTYKIFSDLNRGIVRGENKVEIKYSYKNAIRFGNPDFDELYWNLNGNFWEIQTDNYTAEIILPKEINQNNSKIYLYSGTVGQKDIGLATYRWDNYKNSIIVESTRTFKNGEGITISVTFPKGIITPYVPTTAEKISAILERFSFLLMFIIPFIVFVICFRVWQKHGRDLRLNKTVIAEYEPPQNLLPLEIGFIKSGGRILNRHITATIIDLAVKGFIKIEEYKKGRYKLIYTGKDVKDLKEFEQLIINNIFKTAIANEEVKLTDLRKNKFYKVIKPLKEGLKEKMIKDGIFTAEGFKYSTILSWVGVGLFTLCFVFAFIVDEPDASNFIFIFYAIFISAMIILFFSKLMAKATPLGAEIIWKIKGFKLYMKTAEQYRQQFYEKENIFEKFLPYAIGFNQTKQWIKKMEEIYGQDYFSSYHPAWYGGAIAAESFNASSFATSMNNITNAINSNAGSSSGGSGGGSAGGGGGGGGGGGH